MILSGNTRLAGVIGWPVGHSRSPRLHGFWLKQHGIDGAYVPLAVAPGDLASVLRALSRMGFRGVNLTLPHKEAALALMDEVERLARRIGAVNTVIIEEGRLLGRNTDAFGFLASLNQQQPSWRAGSGPAIVLGAGGAARAVVAALVDAGVPEIRLVNRSAPRAEALAHDLGGAIRVLPWPVPATALADAGLLVNTTLLGMKGQPPLALDLGPLPPAAIVCDIVYTPLQTGLLRAAQARGHSIVDGLGMLLHQARPGFAAWFGIEPAVTDALRDFVLS